MTGNRVPEPRISSTVPVDLLCEVVDSLLDGARSEGIVLRLCSGLACWYRCQEGRGLALAADRTYSDIDFAAYYRDRPRILQLLRKLGFQEDVASGTIPGLRRTIFHGKESTIHGDVFYDFLPFSHTIDLRGRLERDELTVPLSDLLLQKLQIYHFTEKDAVDVQMLLLDHEIDDGDHVIDRKRLADVCGADWGFCRTVSLNTDRVHAIALKSPNIRHPQRARIVDQVAKLQRLLDTAPKSVSWRLRSLLGERVQWYETVDEH